MTAGKILISTAYLPPTEYFSVISKADEILLEKEENYQKQTFRNRSCILTAKGPLSLSIPVFQGSLHKTKIKDIRIDYSKRWQQVHLRAMTASYGSSPYFEFYFEHLERIILKNNTFLLDLNMELTISVLDILKISRKISYTSRFEPDCGMDNDFRFKISPKKESHFTGKEYLQVFKPTGEFIPGMSIVDLIFNTGPDSVRYL
jgi:hypothetical protein